MFNPEKSGLVFYNTAEYYAESDDGVVIQRAFRAKLTVESNGFTIPNTVVDPETGDDVFTSESIASYSFTHSCSSESNIQLGTTCSGQLRISLMDIMPQHIPYFSKGTKIKLRLSRIDVGEIEEVEPTVIDYVERKSYYIDTVDITENTHLVEYEEGVRTLEGYCADIEIVAFDSFYLTEKPFVAPLSAMSSKGLVNYIMVSLLGDSANSSIYNPSGTYTLNWLTDNTISTFPEDITCREMLGYLASLQGCFAYCRTNGVIDAKPFSSDYSTEIYEILQDYQYQDGFSTEQNVTINILESGTNDNVIVSPYTSQAVVGQTISFENPYITTQAQLDDIYADVITNGDVGYPFTYTPGEVEWVGNPNINVGDIVNVEDKYGEFKKIIVMEIQAEYDGSYRETYKCLGAGESTVSFNASATMQKINRNLSTFEKSIIEATDVINQTHGGVFEIIDNDHDGVNDGWKITCTKGRANPDNPEQTITGTHFIKATPGGIGFGTIVDGQEVIDKIGLYFNEQGQGQINAEVLTALQINAGQITFDQNFFNALNTGAQSSGILISQDSISGLDSDLSDLLNLATSANEKANAVAVTIPRTMSCYTEAADAIKQCHLMPGDTDDFVLTNGTTVRMGFRYSNYVDDTPASKAQYVYLQLYRNAADGGACIATNAQGQPLSIRVKNEDGTIITKGTPAAQGWTLSSDKTLVYDGTFFRIQGELTASQVNNTVNSALNQINQEKARYLTCSTGASTAVKVCMLPDTNTMELVAGRTITVKFTNTGYYSGGQSNIKLRILYADNTLVGEDYVTYNGYYLRQNSAEAWSQAAMVSFVYDGGAWVMLDNVANTVISDWCMATNRTYIDGAHIYTGTLEASSIYTGIIGKRTQYSSTVTASTYFDLDNNELITKDTNTGYATKIKAGNITQYNQNGDLITSITPVASSLINPDGEDVKQWFGGFYYNPTTANGLSFGYINGNNVNRILEIKKGNEAIGGYCINEGTKFSGFIHRRWCNYNGTGAKRVELRPGVGWQNVAGFDESIALELANETTGSFTKIARLDIVPNGGANPQEGVEGVILQGENTRGKSKLLVLGDPNLYWNNEPVATNSNFSAFIQDRISHIKINVNGTVYTAYWS